MYGDAGNRICRYTDFKLRDTRAIDRLWEHLRSMAWGDEEMRFGAQMRLIDNRG